jgi:excisionase family DNA binding protein
MDGASIRQWFTYQDIARDAQVHPRTVARWIKSKGIKAWRPTRNTVRLSRAAVRRLFQQGKGSV